MRFDNQHDFETTKLNVKKVFTAYKTAFQYKELMSDESNPHSSVHPLAWAVSWYKKFCKTPVAINYFGNFSIVNLLEFQGNDEIIDFWVYISE